MRIGVNALYLLPGGVGGTEIYLRNLLRALAEIDRVNQYVVFTNSETDAELVPPGFVHSAQNVRAKNRPWRLLWEQIRLPQLTQQLDVLLNPGFTAPALAKCPNVTVFHDLQHKRHPEHFSFLDLPAWNMFLWMAARRSKILLADSEATAHDLQRFYSIPPEQICVAPLGVEGEFFQIAKRREPAPFLLCVSTLHPHKNLERLIRAFASTDAAHKLVIAGLKGHHTSVIEALIAREGLQERVQLTGWIPRENLYELFRTAEAFVYPTTFEGFGLPVLEAMAAGVPMACSAIEPLLSIVGPDAAVYFDPSDEAGMARAVERLLLPNVQTAVVRAGRLRAQQFTWESCARKTLAALQKAASGEDLRAGS
jgi:glycosyltransferase involved in cell wall biosynthesis